MDRIAKVAVKRPLGAVDTSWSDYCDLVRLRSGWPWRQSSVWSVSVEILTKDFVEFIECCVARQVKFLVVGSYALAAHGHPRATKDLDVWIMIEPTNAGIQPSPWTTTVGTRRSLIDDAVVLRPTSSGRPR